MSALGDEPNPAGEASPAGKADSLGKAGHELSPTRQPRRTCLYAEHVALGATLVDFHGWEMPLRYSSIPEEHLKVRLSAGLFDLCHMGRVEVTGKDAAEWVGRAITNDYDAMKPGDARYTLITSERGTIIDDAIVYKLPQSVFLVVNASNREKVIRWMEGIKGSFEASLIDRTEELAMVAIQGPQAVRILPAAVERFDGNWETMKYYSLSMAHIFGKVARIARTGYTGEDGFEVYLDARDAGAFWRHVLEIGGSRITAVGLGARDTLRLEAGMALYGNEIDEETDPFEAGLGFAVKLDKRIPFVGQESLRARKEKGPSRALRGFRVRGRRVARQGMPICLAREASSSSGVVSAGGALPGGLSSGGALSDGAAGDRDGPAAVAPGRATEPARQVGVITSGAPSPTLGHPIAMGYLSTEVSEKDFASLFVDIRGNREPVELEPLPFYSRTRKKAK